MYNCPEDNVFEQKIGKMIGPDRIALNKRFIQAFDALEDRGLVVKNDRNGKGISDMAENILGNAAYGHVIRAWLNPNSKRVIDYKHIDRLLEHYGISPEFMMSGSGPVFETERTHRLPDSEASFPSPGKYGAIMYTSKSALAGSGVNASSQDWEQSGNPSSFSIPGVGGTGLFALKVEGESMTPVMNPEDIIICEKVDYLQGLRNNEICVVCHNGDVWVKYVQTIKQGGQIVKLKLISENKFEFDPFEVNVDESTSIFRVIRRIHDISA